jgi:hypothetical protein
VTGLGVLSPVLSNKQGGSSERNQFRGLFFPVLSAAHDRLAQEDSPTKSGLG